MIRTRSLAGACAAALMLAAAACGSSGSSTTTTPVVDVTVATDTAATGTPSSETPATETAATETEPTDTATEPTVTATQPSDTATQPSDTATDATHTTTGGSEPSGSDVTTGASTGGGGAFTSPNGLWSATFPATPTSQEQTNAKGLKLTVYSTEVGGDAFIVAQPNDGVTITSVDFDKEIEGVLTNLGGTVTNSTPTTVGGHEARRYTGQAERGGQTATVEGLVVVTDKSFVEALAVDVDADNSERATQFIDSIMINA